MNIVVLDGYTLNPGDMDWNELKSLGHCTIYDRTAPHEIVARAGEAEIVLTNKVQLNRSTLTQLPHLRFIGVLATGYNIVDVAEAKERNILVSNVPAYSTMSVAQTVFSLLFEMTHHAGHHSAEVKKGRWASSKDFSFWDFPLVEMSGKTFGIVGFGNAGQAVARIALALGMRVRVSTRNPEKYQSWMVQGEQRVEFTSLETIFKESDVISLHCALTEQTKELVNAERLALMKKGAFLINTSRGGVVHEQALADALNAGAIAGAGLDVLSTEPPSPDNPLLHAKNCVITPHIAWASREARQRLMQTVVQNVKSFIKGNPVNLVS